MVMQRPRRNVPRFVPLLLKPIYRRSSSRSQEGKGDIYILRLVGNQIGPVLKSRE